MLSIYFSNYFQNMLSINDLQLVINLEFTLKPNRVNHPDCTLEQTLANILLLARQRPVIIQSLFPAIPGEGPHGTINQLQKDWRMKELERLR